MGAGCCGHGCGLQNSHPQPTLIRDAGYPNPLRVVFLTIRVGMGFLFSTCPSAPLPPPMETSRRGSFVAQCLSTVGANKCSISINEISRDQQTESTNFLVSHFHELPVSIIRGEDPFLPLQKRMLISSQLEEFTTT